MNITVFGLNHKTAPIEMREKFYLNPTQQDLLLSELRSNPAVVEAFVLSTCNRVEIYFSAINDDLEISSIISLVFKVKRIPPASECERYFYKFCGKDAVRHLFEVSTGIDSLIIGEDQILGQVKIAFQRAQGSRMFQRHFNILANMALNIGKKARRETNIAVGGSSISWAAVAKAEEVLGNLSGKSILVIGAGEMSELAVGHIQDRKFHKLYIMNRTQDNARALVHHYGGTAVPFCDLKEILQEVDICLCSAGAPHYLVEKDVVQRIMGQRNGRVLIFIDISMPRNIDPRVSGLDNVLLYQIDDLNAVVDASMAHRAQAILKVKSIIESKIEIFLEKIRKSDKNEITRMSGPSTISD